MTDLLTPTNKPPELILTPEQEQAVHLIKTWMTCPASEFKLGGYAGTGKTTIIKAILKQLADDYNIEVGAFTGKAVNVLSRKGVHASTLHSLLYDVEPLPKGQVKFNKKTKLLGNPDLIIVDEASMVSTEIYNDLISFKKKYLFVGDPGQLEPVGENPNLMAKPDFVLSKIHRQAGLSPIITLANRVRQGGLVLPPVNCDPALVVCNKKLKTSDVISFDQIICAKNKTRQDINAKMRFFNQLAPQRIVNGEKLIILKNNISFGIFNGMILFVTEITDDLPNYWEVTAKDETGRIFNDLPIWKTPFENPTSLTKDVIIPRLKDKTQLVYADYGYCITCHKSQGSEWDNVLVWDEWMPPTVWDMKRWRYTAITRAAKKLTYCL